MALSELKRISYVVSGILVDVEKGEGFNAKSKADLERVFHDLKVLDQQSTEICFEFESVEQVELERHLKELKARDNDPLAAVSVALLEKLWRNIKKVDKRLVEKS